MTSISKGLCWAGSLIALAFANRFGLIADQQATTLFALFPALWVATGWRADCNLRRRAQG